jgi:monoamine oxidase
VTLHVCVVGAGFAGLAAADALTRAGVRVTLLEARRRVGGRVGSRTLDDGSVVEMGAEFILPGYDTMRGLLDREGLGLWDKGMFYGDREPRGVELDGIDLGAAYGRVATARPAPGGESVAALLDRLGLPPAAAETIRARTEISSASPAGRVDASVLGHLAAADRTPCPSVAGGNMRLAEALARGLGRAVMLGEPVSAVTWDDAHVTVRAGTIDVSADAAIVAVPPPCVLDVAFSPALPDAVLAELRSVAMGHAAKLFVPVASALGPSAVMSVPGRYWTWTARGGDERVQPLVSCFAGSAGALERLDVAAGPERWLGSLAALRPDLDLQPERAVLSTWSDDRYSQGAYSVHAPGGVSVDALHAGVGRLSFAGEHMAGDWSALMEGALRSGIAAAERVLGGGVPRGSAGHDQPELPV